MSRHTHVAWARRALRATTAGLRRLPTWPATRVRRAVLGDALDPRSFHLGEYA